MKLKHSVVAIIDYGMGNLQSVQRACETVGINSIITSDKKIILSSSAVILPGVGGFRDAIYNLTKLDLVEPIKAVIDSGKIFMGICLGMQLLMSESEEFGLHKGFNVIKGRVVRFPNQFENMKVRVPQINWNKIISPDSVSAVFNSNSLLKNIKCGEYMYFLHSYYVLPDEKEVALCKTVYAGIEYCSGFQKGNIFAFQFHPEKSGYKGLQIYKSFKETLA